MHEIFHQAGWIMLSPSRWVKDGVVGIRQGKITYVGPYKSPRHNNAIDHGPGLIMPALVNAHTHLGLSMLRDQVRTNGGFLEWIMDLIAKREKYSSDQIRQAVKEAVHEVCCSGTGLVAEVGVLEPTRTVLQDSGVDTVLFTEVLGHNPNPDFPLIDESNIIESLAGHALHTTSPDTLVKLKEITKKAKKPFSIHLAESRLETEFLTTGQGPWADLLGIRGIDYSLLGPFGQSPVTRAANLNLLDQRTLAVHLLEVDEKDMGVLADTGTRVVLCPRSNMILHNKVPDIKLFLKHGLRPALGTDSLASCPTLSMFHEMAFVARNFPDLSPQVILEMGTKNGALALGRPDLGTIEVGNSSKLIYVYLDEKAPERVMERLLSGQEMRVERIDLFKNGDHFCPKAIFHKGQGNGMFPKRRILSVRFATDSPPSRWVPSLVP